jgi:hypothetical protein
VSLSSLSENYPSLRKIGVGTGDVLADLTDEEFRAGVLLFSPELAEKTKTDPTAIKRGLEIEYVGFDLQTAAGESGPVSDIRDRGMRAAEDIGLG